MAQSSKLPIEAKPQIPAHGADSVPDSLVGMPMEKADVAVIAKIKKAYDRKVSASVFRQHTAHTPNVGYEGDVSASAEVPIALGRPIFLCKTISTSELRSCTDIPSQPYRGKHPGFLVLPLKLVEGPTTKNHRQHERQHEIGLSTGLENYLCQPHARHTTRQPLCRQLPSPRRRNE